MKSATDDRRFKAINRRELLKLTPVLALGAFAISKLQKPLLKSGLAFSDWASAELFHRGHLAPTFPDSALTPFNKFPINDYDVDDPEIDFDKWTLTVGGAVQKPGLYLGTNSRAAQDQAEYSPRLRRGVGCDRPLWRRAALGLPQDDRRRPWCAFRYRRMR